MDCGVFLNLEWKNVWVIILVDVYENVVVYYEIDMWVYVNNYFDGIGVY